MLVGLGIERMVTIAAAGSFTLPDAWKWYTYDCAVGATLTITNSLGESMSHSGSGSSQAFGMGGVNMTFAAAGGSVKVKYFL